MKKICIITGTRAEYGLLRWVMEEIISSPKLDLQLIVTGMHLSPEFGLTSNMIEKDGFFINHKVEMLLSSDTTIGITKSIGLGIIGFADALNNLKPDMIVLLGDRFEAFAAATSAMVSRIPIAHIHGGEATEGLIDEAIRHSITKMSHLHFVSTEKYKQRVVQLGEQPKRVFNVGALGIDNIYKLKLIKKKEVESILNFKFLKKNLLITFHPVTLENNTSRSQIKEIIEALKEFPKIGLIFTMPNADTNGRAIYEMIEEFCKTHLNAKAYVSLGQLKYLSCMKYIDGILGNSSSGIIEAPSFKKGTINIGDRQNGRLMANSVINCNPKKKEIVASINLLFSEKFKHSLKNVINPYAKKDTSKNIVRGLEKINFAPLLKKQFNDISE